MSLFLGVNSPLPEGNLPLCPGSLLTEAFFGAFDITGELYLNAQITLRELVVLPAPSGEANAGEW